MGNSIYTSSVFRSTKLSEKELQLVNLVFGDSTIKASANRLFQKANRRIQNITNKGYASPAVKAIIAERGKHDYTYFSSANLDLTNPSDFERLQYEIGRALAFLQNPTSTATGARQYIQYQADRLNGIPFESANKIVDIATEPTIDEYGNVNIFSYGDILDEMKNDVQLYADSMSDNAVDFAEQLEDRIIEEYNKSKSDGDFLDSFFDNFTGDDE